MDEMMEDEMYEMEMEAELERIQKAEHPDETWMQACGDPHCTWGCGEAWVPNEKVLA